MTSICIVIPTMNRRDLLKIALDSLAAQTRPCTEALVIDAGNDGSDVLCSDYAFVRYVRQTSKGLTPARNEALRLIEADYIGMLDSDDYYEPRFLEVCAGLLDRGADIAYSRGYRVTPQSRQEVLINHRLPENFLRALVNDNFLIASFALQRKQCFEQSRGYREGLALADDYDLYLRFCLAGFRFAHAPEHLSNRLHHDGSLTLSNPAANIQTVAEILAYHQAALCKKLHCSAQQLLGPSHLRLARHYYEQGDTNQAQAALKQALRANPWQLGPWIYWLACLTAPYSTSTFRFFQRLKQAIQKRFSRLGMGEQRW